MIKDVQDTGLRVYYRIEGVHDTGLKVYRIQD